MIPVKIIKEVKPGQMSVSVIIINWNSGVLLDKCLQCLSEQTLLPDNIIVVDNNSNDGSETYVEQYSKINLLKMSSNLGFAAGNNRALSECNTKYVALLNPDAFPKTNWLESLVEFAIAYPEAAAFGSRQLSDNKPIVLDGIGDAFHISGLVWRDRYGSSQQSKDLDLKEIFSPCAAAALYLRQAVMDVGGFDEEYFCYVEDVDLGFRLRLAGYKAMYVPTAVVYHIGSAITGGQQSDFSVYYGHRNLVWTYIKNMPGVLLWIFLPLHLLLNIFSLIIFSCRGQGKVIILSKIDAIRGLPGMWRKRRKIQTARVASISELFRMMDKRLLPRYHG